VSWLKLSTKEVIQRRNFIPTTNDKKPISKFTNKPNPNNLTKKPSLDDLDSAKAEELETKPLTVERSPERDGVPWI